MHDRVRSLNSHPIRRGGRYVLYWSQMNRRVDSNHALAQAIALADEHNLPVLYYEGLTCSYPYANDRLHTFILEGVPGTARRLQQLGIGYVFYLRRSGAGANDVLYQLAANAAAIVTDDYPTFIARTHNASVQEKVRVAYHVVDSSCVVPMSRHSKREYGAYTIRPKIRKALPEYLRPVEVAAPRKGFGDPVPEFHTTVTNDTIASLVASCEIDHTVAPSTFLAGGRTAGLRRLEHFLEHNLSRYAGQRNEPSRHATSNLSAYLHFGHISSLEVALAARSYAAAHALIADEFLEELIVRRELAFNFARLSDDYSLETLPDWAQQTLRDHAADPREPAYTLEEFETARTHDTLWNATQKEMLLRGVIHGYYRMYWGKKIIEWSPTPKQALETMIHIHDRYALDGRDPNTYANILWCFGLHDRPWKERAIFGKVRYMSLGGMERKTDTAAYIREIRDVEETGRDPLRLQ